MNDTGLSQVRVLVRVAVIMLLLLAAAYVVLALNATPVSFVDSGLEQAVRRQLGRERGTLALADLERITRLDAEARGIVSLEGIERLANLEQLDLRGNRIADLTPLAALARLRQLDLRDNGIVDLESANLARLAVLPRLRELSLRHNRGPSHPESPQDHQRISDLTVLAAFTGLESLDLRDNHIRDIRPLSGLHRLVRLDLRDNRLHDSDLSALSGLSRLEYLNLRHSGISDLNGIEALRNLVYLNLHSNATIESVEPLSRLPRLQTLIVRNVPIGEQLEVFESLTALRRLNLRNCGIEDLTPLARLMQRGALQDDAQRGIYAEVDIRENLVTFFQEDGYAVLAPYWENVARRHPQELPPPLSREIVINEVMSSNGSTIDDGSGSYPDWIELYNPGSSAVDLAGYYLSDHRDRSARWRFPEGAVVGAGEHLLVWASGRDTVGPDGRFHTGFRISSGGEAAVLTGPDGRSRVDALLIPPLPRDRSYGRLDPGELTATTFAVPTPGFANKDGHRYRNLWFSHSSGFHRQGFDLVIRARTEDAAASRRAAADNQPVTIYYTLDGSLPDPAATDDPVAYRVGNHATGELETWYQRTYRYDGPIAIRDQREEGYTVAAALRGVPRIVHIDTTSPNARFWQWQPPRSGPLRGTVVRAAAYIDSPADGQQGGQVQVSDVVSATFFVVADGEERFTLPVVALTTPSSGLFDFDDGIYVPGRIYEESQPYDGIWMAQQANYSQSWERPAHIEFFEADGSRSFALDGGIRVHGTYSRAHPLKSLRLYARKSYSATGSFEYPVFPDAVGRGSPQSSIDSYKRLILRSGQSLFRSHLQDAVIQHWLADHVEVDLLRYRPVVHFINGEYWGIKNLRERFDRFYVEANYGIAADDVIVVEGPFGYDSQLREGRPGENRPFFELHRFIVEQDMRDAGNYERVQREMDVLSFIDYNIVRIYSADRDGIDKHIAVWRKRTDFDPLAPRGHDGRWRWHTWDFDNAFMYQHNTIEYYAADGFGATQTQDQTSDADADAAKTAMIVNLFHNDQFRTLFINRFASLLNTVLQPRRMSAAIDAAAALLAPEIGEHIERWGYPESVEYWRNQVDSHRKFVSKRPLFDRDYLEAYFGRRGYPVRGRYSLLVRNQDPVGGYVRVGFVDVREGTPGVEDPSLWSGIWFGDVPLQLHAVPAAGYRFAGWRGDLQAAVSAVGGTPPSDSAVIVIRTAEDITLCAAFRRLE
ncbi:MAG: hypothetical protein EA384_15660 [Spirochaetaceae bacterium]|nr:MAG: hypothetical protein EA384_15660 [Spirochaetaceae bacterium]